MRTGTIWMGALAMVLMGAAGADAGNWSVLTRHFHEGPTYGCHPHAGWQDCMMPWQPIQSSMHYNVLPPGMHRPLPLRRPIPSLAPKTPDFSAAGVRAAGQWNKGVPCQNPYSLPPAGCDYYCQKTWWDHLCWWKKPAASASPHCPSCAPHAVAPAGMQAHVAAAGAKEAPTPAVQPVPAEFSAVMLSAPVEVSGAFPSPSPTPYAAEDQARGRAAGIVRPATVTPAPLPPPVEGQPWLR